MSKGGIIKSMKLTENEKRDVVKLIEKGKVLPEKYRFLLFDESKQVELTWNGKSDEVTNVVLPFQIIEQIDEPRNEEVKMAQGSFGFFSYELSPISTFMEKSAPTSNGGSM